MVKGRDPASWRLTSTNEFNGAAEDHFAHTSLHLSFTNYYAPLAQTDRQQGQDHHVFFRGCVVLVYCSGEWIGDLDVLKSLILDRPWRVESTCCSCSQPRTICETTSPVTSVENWEDVLDPPSGEFVVRASGNWVARLATASMLAQSGKIGLEILPSSICWKCCRWARPGAGAQTLPLIKFPFGVRGAVY